MADKRSRRELANEEVIVAATELAKLRGMQFSMRELAASLNTWPNALYKFYPTKQALQAVIINRLMGEALTVDVLADLEDESKPWQHRMRVISGVVFDVAAQVAGLGRLLTHESMFASPPLLTLVYSIVEQLIRLGLSRKRAGELVQIVAFYLLSMGELEAAQRRGGTTAGEFEPGKAVDATSLADDAITALLSYDKRERTLAGVDLMIAAAEAEIAACAAAESL
ncbi:MAG: TetR family transcriptional regulator [Pseudomonadota bacterium]